VPADARLEDARHLQALHVPSPRLDLTPRHILQQPRPLTGARRAGRVARGLGAAVLIHAGFAIAFVYLLSFRDAVPPREVELPVEIVTLPAEPPKPAPPKGDARESSGQGGSGSKVDGSRPDAARPSQTQALQQALAAPVAPDPHPPAPPRIQPVTPTPAPEPAPAQPQAAQPRAARPSAAPPPPRNPAGGAAGPKLVEAPPEPTRAATDAKPDKPANLEPDLKQVDAATHEARPAEVPRTLATSDPQAAFAVPAPLPPKPNPVEKPAAPVPARTASATDKLAAALPMDLSAMPLSFRNVLSGNGAQVSAAYKGLVYGRFNRDIAERAQRQHLKGQVIVAFTIGDTGEITDLSVVQSSGIAALDALGLEMIRSAAPFPPPPPEAQRSFTPAFSFGP
jgi:protein TonB